ncbi:MAG TPA: cation:proton antiporter [Verrucomicrobiae bacterium]
MTLYQFIGSAIVVLAISYLAAGFSRRLGLGSILGLLAAGAILGPSGFKVTESAEGLREFTELGVVFLLFVIGLQLNPSKLWGMRADVLGLGLAQLVATGGALAVFLHSLGAQSWSHAGLGGLILALSSTAFVMQLLQDRKELNSDHGRISFAVLLAQDLAVIPLLALVSMVARGDGSTGAPHSLPPRLRLGLIITVLAAIVLMGRYVAPWLLAINARRRNPSGFTAVTMLAVLVAAWLAYTVGLSMALGGFVVGLLLSASPFHLQIQSSAEHWKETLLSLFFIAVGMNINFGVLLREGLIVVVLVVGILLIKAAVLLLLCMLFRKRAGTSVRTALLCAQCGEFAFVLLALSQRFGIIAEEGASIGVLTVSVTMALTPLLAKLADSWGRRVERSEPLPGPLAPLGEIPEPMVIIGGFGRCGEAVGAFLRQHQIPFAALDLDWDKVAAGRQRGYPVSGGDMTDYTVLRNAGAARCRLLVIASNDTIAAERAILAFRLIAPPSTPIVVRVQDRAQAQKLKTAGASRLVVEYDEIGQRLIDSVGLALDLSDVSGPNPKG